jgi:DUF1680 family protein
MVGKKMYVQGSIGAVGDGERFGANYELPNATAYNETCAAIGNVFGTSACFYCTAILNILMCWRKLCITV